MLTGHLLWPHNSHQDLQNVIGHLLVDEEAPNSIGIL